MKFVIFVLISCMTSVVQSDDPVHYTCQQIGSRCIFENLIIDQENYDWEPVAPNPSAVEHIQFRDSHILVLTDGICDAFPQLISIDLTGQQVQGVFSDALENCDNLEILYLGDNVIVALSGELFEFNKKLQTLHLNGNWLSELNINLFASLTKLSILNISQNMLEEFPVDIVKGIGDLRELYLNSNQLRDLEVEKIINYLPNLRTLSIGNNQIPSARMEEIAKVLEANGIVGSTLPQ